MTNSYTWFGGSGFGNVGTNWTPAGPPGPGAVAIVNSGTVMLVNSQLSDNLVDLNAGTFQITNTTGSLFVTPGAIDSGFDNQTTLIGGANGPASLAVFGDFVNEGTIEAFGNTLTIAISAYVTTGVSLAGTLLNDGVISVANGATLDVTGSGANTLEGGDVVVQQGTAVVTVADIGSDFALEGTATLDLDSVASNASVTFSGTTNLLALNSSALDSTINISGFAGGDTLDIGANAIGTIVYQDGGSGTPVLTIIGTNGATLLSDPFSTAAGGFVGSNSGTFTVSTLASGTVAVGPFEVATGSNGDTLLELLPPSTWDWTDADPGDINNQTNWTLLSGPGNQQGTPNAGDTIIANDATFAFGLNNTVNGNTIYLTGTSAMSFAGTQAVAGSGTGGKSGISYQNPTVDSASVISNDPVPPSSTTLNFAGYNVSEGTLISNGGAGSNLTINVTQNGTAPGYLINYGDIEADVGNSVTIAVAGTSEVFNANLIYANGGTVIINGGNGIAGGDAPMLGGVALIGDGGTLEVNAGFPSGTPGSSPTFAFYDGDHGDTLILKQIGQFGGRILGFQQGDTIDLGTGLAIGKIAVTADGRVLLENNNGGVLDTLVLSSGAYATGTFGVTLVATGTQVAGGFTLTTGGDGDTLLTTDVVNSVWNDTSGTWQTVADWSTGAVPGATSSVFIGNAATAGADTAISPFDITTGTTAVTVNSLSEVNSNATLQITSATTIGTSTNDYGISQIAGEIEVTGGNTLTAPFLKQLSPGADLQIDAGGVLVITGHSNLGFANNGVISGSTVVNGATFANGNTVGLLLTGTATVDGGMIDDGPVLNGTVVVSSGGLTNIGQDGGAQPASVTVESAGTVVDTYAFVSSDPTSFGSLTLTGAGTTWDDAGDPTDTLNTRGYMLVGDDNQSGNQPSPLPSGTAQLVVENDATLNEATNAQIGVSADSAGSATITSGGVWNIGTSSAGGFLYVGGAGSGTLDIDGGTVNVLAGSSVAAGGFAAAGTYTSGGTLVTGAAGMGIAHQVGGNGTVDVSGGGQLDIAISPTISSAGFGVGQLGEGVLDIFDGGTVSIAGGGISAGSSSTVVTGGSTVAGDGTIVVGGTFDASGSVVTTGGPDSVLVSTGGMSIGKAGTGTLFVEAGGTVQVSGGNINVGNSAGAYGCVEVNGGLVEDTSNGLNVGNAGTGTLLVINSGSIALTGGGIDVGMSAGSQGLLEIASGGMLTSTTNGLDVGVNAGSVGTLEVLAGGIYNVSTHGLAAGFAAGSVGTILVNGTGAQINIGAQSAGSGMDVGDGGTGFLTVENNGIVSDAGVSINVGLLAGASGTVAVASGGLIATTGTQGITVGNSGAGLVTIGAAGTVSAANFFSIAQGSTSTGTVVVNGGTLDDGGIFNVGGSGAGTLVVEGGGVIDQTGLGFFVGANAGGYGTVAVNGGTVLGNGMSVGGFGVGTLSVTGGGQVVLNGGNGFGIGASVGGTGSGAVFINGGTVTETGNGVSVGGTNESGFLLVGTLGELVTTGTSAIIGGVTVFPQAGNINASGSGNAAVTVSGGTWIANGQISVGGSGTGSLGISGGGLVNAGTNGVFIGSQSGGAGTLTVGTGGTLLAGNLTIANAFTGTASGILTIATGGTVQVGSLNEGTSGTVSVSGMLAATGGVTLGQSGSGPSGLVVNSGGTLTDAGFLTVGNNGTGMLLVQAGGVVDQTGSSAFEVGQNTGGSGAVIIDGGVFNAGSNFVALGNVSNATGALTIESGGSMSAGAVTLGGVTAGTGVGALTVTGGGSRLTAQGEMGVGGGGTGSLLVENQATAITGASSLAVGFDIAIQTGASGAVTVSGAQSLLGNTGELIVGDGGLGSLSIQSSGSVTTAPGAAGVSAVVGNQASADGSSVQVIGAGSDWQISGALIVGNAGAGALNIAAGGAVIATSVDLAAQSGSSGDLSLSGTASVLTTSGSLAVGDAGAGELSILNGASVTIGGDLDVGQLTNGSGNVDIENASVSVGGNLNLGLGGGAGVVTVGTGGTLHVTGGLIGGIDSALNEFGAVDPNFDDGVNANVGVSGTQDFPGYIDGFASFTIDAGVTLTLESPSIYNNVAFVMGGKRDTTAAVLVLNTGSVSADTTVMFTNAHDTLVLGINALQTIDIQANDSAAATFVANPSLGVPSIAQFLGMIDTFKAGDQIVVDTTAAATFMLNGSTVEVVSAANTLVAFGSLVFDSAANAQTAFNTAGALVDVSCFAAGTRIRTTRGEVLVEALLAGDVAITAIDGSDAPVVWVGHREVDCARHPQPETVWPVRISAGAFGRGLPKRTLTLSPDHAVYVNAVLVPVKRLINGTTIRQVQVDRVTYYHVELDRHDVLYADGMPAESYLDVGDRGNFANGGAVVRLHMDLAHHWEAGGCAPLVVWGAELEGVRKVVAAQEMAADRASREHRVRTMPRRSKG